MRIYFRHIGDAERCLRKCKIVLSEDVPHEPGARLPWRHARNELSGALGYSSYSELQKIHAIEHQPSDSENLREALVAGFQRTIRSIERNGFVCNDDLRKLAEVLAARTMTLLQERMPSMDRSAHEQFSLPNKGVAQHTLERLARMVPAWSISKCRSILAAMMGYSSWESLLDACETEGRNFVYEQDLNSNTELEERLLVLAQRVANAAKIELPYAHDLVYRLAPTSDIERPCDEMALQDKALDRVLEKDPGLWVLTGSIGGNLFVPPGLIVSTGCIEAEIAEARSIGVPLLEQQMDKLVFLTPHKLYRHETGSSVMYFRREEVMEIEPIPDVSNACAPLTNLREPFIGGHLNSAQRKALISEWKPIIAQLLEAAGIPKRLKLKGVEWVAITTEARRLLGKPWYWPLKPVDPQSPAVRAAEEVVRITEESLKASGRLPGYVIWHS